MNLLRRLLACLFAFVAPAYAQNLLLNGSFESYGATSATITSGSPNSTMVTNWTFYASSGSAQVIRASAGPTPVNGSYFLSLNYGDTTAGVLYLEQSFTTMVGATYLVSFSAGRSASGSGTIGATAQIFDAVTGSTVLGSVTSSGTTPTGSAFFTPASFSFVATTTTSRLRLSDSSTASFQVDLALDNASVTLTAIPEPSTVAMFTSAAALGLAARRRRLRLV